jgi:polar amino acid transport system permease protein
MVTVGLGLTAAAYMAETIRAGIQAVPKGQMEAARSLGMSTGRTMFSIIIPQAFRIVIPPLTNELILLVKDSSLVYVLGVSVAQYELTKFGSSFLVSKASPTPLIVVALAYLRHHPAAVQPGPSAREALRQGPLKGECAS